MFRPLKLLFLTLSVYIYIMQIISFSTGLENNHIFVGLVKSKKINFKRFLASAQKC